MSSVLFIMMINIILFLFILPLHTFDTLLVTIREWLRACCSCFDSLYYLQIHCTQCINLLLYHVHVVVVYVSIKTSKKINLFVLIITLQEEMS